jgi:pilus assembly protein CpaD
MKRTKTFSLLALGLIVTACGGTDNRGVESIHQPVVSRADYAFDVSSDSQGLASGESGRLAGWFEALNLGYGDRVSVDVPGGYDPSGTRAAVASVAARYGLLIDETAPVTAGDIPPGAVRVVVSRLKASVPGCNDWSRKTDINYNNHSGSNYGCATNSNLAAMVANPQDLVRGQQGAAVADAASASKAIKSYRDAEPTGKGGLKQERIGGN